MRSFEQHVRCAKAFVFDFYCTLVVDAVSVPPMWQHLNELGYRSNAALQAIFEPDAFDGCLTPSFTTKPSHDEWLLSNWRRFVELSGVPTRNRRRDADTTAKPAGRISCQVRSGSR